jgi:methyltransferase (TIGR00027 family)
LWWLGYFNMANDVGSSRRENDSRDVVSGVGLTALGAALARAVMSDGADPLVRDESARLFVEAAAEPNMLQSLREPEATLMSFLVPMAEVRTRFFDEYFMAARRAGVRQAVILAAGLDVRAHRLAWPAGMVIFELDQPDVLEFKEAVLAEHGVPQLAADRRGVRVDLRDDWPAALTAASDHARADPARA